VEERRLATWGTEVPEDLVLDEKLLAEALRKVNKNPALLNQLGNY
jgi:pre-mRNA-processing factor SLU7